MVWPCLQPVELGHFFVESWHFFCWLKEFLSVSFMKISGKFDVYLYMYVNMSLCGHVCVTDDLLGRERMFFTR